MNWQQMSKSSRITIGVAALAGLTTVLLAGFSVIYAGKVYPGVYLNGVDVGGMSRAEATARLHAKAAHYSAEQIPVTYNNVTLRVPVSGLGLTYNDEGVAAAMSYGRSGSLAEQVRARMRSLFGRHATYQNYTFDDSKLSGVMAQIDEDVNTPVANATLRVENNEIGIASSQPGRRFDRGMLLLALQQRFASMDPSSVTATVYDETPSITEEVLEGAKSKAESLAARDLTVEVAGATHTVSRPDVLSWIDVTTPGGRSDMPIDRLKSFYPEVTVPTVAINLNTAKVGVYVAALATNVDQQPRNAVLAMQEGAIRVVQGSRDGLTLDQAKAVQQITQAITSHSNDTVRLATKVQPAEISEKNLDSLGIKELISEGKTFFPGSSADRMTNVRVGAAKYNGVLLKPGEVFSFGKILGDVGPAQGYVPELVILGDHEEKQYGGGLCQVASTAYRAALLAGLPILERHNHSFAVSYYTAPYGVPGVDATIYYPQVDFKFKNDTGHYILIQTKMEGTTLTFDYYGTKTKYGEIRGPQFISGTTDTTQPSHTVFWRDVKDPSGKLIKTDTVETYYEPSTNFPIQKQYN